MDRIPENIANPAGVAAGDPPQYRVRQKWDMPADHSNTAAAAVVSLHRAKAVRHTDYRKEASSTLTTFLLASRGETNTNHLKTIFPALKTYMFSPRDIVDSMRQA